MKSKVSWILFSGLVLSLTTGCGKNGLGKSGSDDGGGVRAESLSDDAMLDQLGSSSTITTVKPLYVNENTNVVSDIEEDNSKVLSCVLNLPNTETRPAAYWIPAGTTYPIVAAKIGSDRSFALAMTADGDPFEVPRLSCWAIKEDTQPLTIQFLREAIAPSFVIDARH